MPNGAAGERPGAAPGGAVRRPRFVRARLHRKAHDVCAGARAAGRTTCRRCARWCVAPRRRTTGCRRSSSGIVSSDAFRMQALRPNRGPASQGREEGLTMFLTKRHLSRRTVLKGAGVTLALPLLDAMVPAATALAQTAASPKLRMGFFYIPHGAIMGNTSHGAEMDKWTPQRRGRRLHAQSDPQVARAAQEVRHLVRQPVRTRRWSAACTASRRPRG